VTVADERADAEESRGVSPAGLVAELAGLLGAPHEARFIVEEVLVSSRGALDGALDGAFDPDAVAAARRMASRRAAGEPLQYVFGHWPFRSLDLVVDPRVLIPRPETEQVVEVALAEARRLAALRESAAGLVAVDAGTGSGAIALSLAAELGPAMVREVWATDADAGALEVAAANLDALGRRLGASLAAVRLAEGSWLEPLPRPLRGLVDLVVSNPPYVSEQEWASLDAEVRAEPRRALVAGPASDGTPGLADVETVLEQARHWLADPGAVVVELAPHQAAAAVRLADRLGYGSAEVRRDLAGRLRALVARAERGLGPVSRG
jgi:release factor glutamine methyltransferase